MNIFGEEWKAWRLKNRFTLRIVSERLSLSIGYISDIEQGRKSPPDLEVVRKYEEMVGAVDHPLVIMASKLKTKVRSDVAQSLKMRPKLNDLMLRATDLTDEQIDELIQEMDKKRD